MVSMGEWGGFGDSGGGLRPFALHSRAMSRADTIEPVFKEKTKSKPKVAKPSFYVVVVHNDPVTPRDFVVEVLRRYFDKGESEAKRIMLLAHNYGIGVVAKYSRDIAETKAKIVNQFCRDSGFPLYFSIEEE